MNFVPGDCCYERRPNYSGKSVYLKQVALILVLAQLGCCVPAESAKLRPVNSIQTRVASFEATSQGYSSFFMDAAQVATMLDARLRSSLLLIDEFGKGTADCDGIALLAATLNALLRRRPSDGMMCLCATHFSEVLADGIMPMDNPRLAVFSMEMLVRSCPAQPQTALLASRSTSRQAGEEKPSQMGLSTPLGQQTYIKTFRLLRGSICCESRALQCALEQGISRDLLSRAAEVKAVICSVDTSKLRVNRVDTRLQLCLQDTQTFLGLDLSTGDGSVDTTPR